MREIRTPPIVSSRIRLVLLVHFSVERLLQNARFQTPKEENAPDHRSFQESVCVISDNCAEKIHRIIKKSTHSHQHTVVVVVQIELLRKRCNPWLKMRAAHAETLTS